MTARRRPLSKIACTTDDCRLHGWILHASAGRQAQGRKQGRTRRDQIRMGRGQIIFGRDQVRPALQQLRRQSRRDRRLAQPVQPFGADGKAFRSMADEKGKGTSCLGFLLFELGNDQLGIRHRGALRRQFSRTGAARVVACLREAQDALRRFEVQARQRDSFAQR
jgi:hypothetical protein